MRVPAATRRVLFDYMQTQRTGISPPGSTVLGGGNTQTLAYRFIYLQLKVVVKWVYESHSHFFSVMHM